jgi:hypothetical protein
LRSDLGTKSLRGIIINPHIAIGFGDQIPTGNHYQPHIAIGFGDQIPTGNHYQPLYCDRIWGPNPYGKSLSTLTLRSDLGTQSNVGVWSPNPGLQTRPQTPHIAIGFGDPIQCRGLVSKPGPKPGPKPWFPNPAPNPGLQTPPYCDRIWGPNPYGESLSTPTLRSDLGTKSLRGIIINPHIAIGFGDQIPTGNHYQPSHCDRIWGPNPYGESLSTLTLRSDLGTKSLRGIIINPTLRSDLGTKSLRGIIINPTLRSDLGTKSLRGIIINPHIAIGFGDQIPTGNHY